MLAEPMRVKIDGVEMKVGGFTQSLQENFAKYTEMVYYNYIKEDKYKGKLSQPEYCAMVRDHQLQSRNQAFEWRSDLMCELLKSDEHWTELMYQCFSEYNTIDRAIFNTMVENNRDEFIRIYNELVQTQLKKN